MENQTEFKDQFKDALLHFSYNYFVYFIFVVPFDLWKKATIRLSEQKASGSLNISKINSSWPFLSFLKTFIIEFLIDGCTFMAYVLAPFIAIGAWITTGEFMMFITTLVVCYFAPLYYSLLRDFIQILILPFRKFLDWAKKPAQHMDFRIENKN